MHPSIRRGGGETGRKAAVALQVYRAKDSLQSPSEACFFLIRRPRNVGRTKTVSKHARSTHTFEANVFDARLQIP